MKKLIALPVVAAGAVAAASFPALDATIERRDDQLRVYPTAHLIFQRDLPRELGNASSWIEGECDLIQVEAGDTSSPSALRTILNEPSKSA